MKQIELQIKSDNAYYISNPTMFLQLKNIVENHYSHGAYGRIINKKENIKLLKWINNSLPLLQNSIFNISTKCYWILYDLHEFPTCLSCNKQIDNKNILDIRRGYAKYCSKLCQITSKEFKEQRILTWRKKYNDDSITTLFRQSWLKKNHVKHVKRLMEPTIQCKIKTLFIKCKIQNTKNMEIKIM